MKNTIKILGSIILFLLGLIFLLGFTVQIMTFKKGMVLLFKGEIDAYEFGGLVFLWFLLGLGIVAIRGSIKIIRKAQAEENKAKIKDELLDQF